MKSWNLKIESSRPIGLDIGYDSVRMIQLAAGNKRNKVLYANEVRLDPGANENEQLRKDCIISSIKQMMAEGEFRGKKVISCLPNNKLKITSIRLNEIENNQIEDILKKEAAQRFNVNPENDLIKYLVAGSVKHGDEIKNELILLTSEHQTIKEHIEMLEQADLEPVGIDAIPCALFRSFERFLQRHEDKERTVVFADVSSRLTTIVFGRGTDITFIKKIPIGGETFNQEIAAKLGITNTEAQILRETLKAERTRGARNGPAGSSEILKNYSCLDVSTRQAVVDAITAVAEDLAKEMSLCFRYYTVTFRGKRLEKAVFAGGEAYESILLNVLKQQLTVNIEVAQPLKGFDIMNINFEGDRRGLLCEWAVAVGLALKNT